MTTKLTQEEITEIQKNFTRLMETSMMDKYARKQLAEGYGVSYDEIWEITKDIEKEEDEAAAEKCRRARSFRRLQKSNKELDRESEEKRRKVYSAHDRKTLEMMQKFARRSF